MFCYRLLNLCFLFVFCPALFAASAFADDELAKRLDAGTWAENPRYLTFGYYNKPLKWRILEVKDKDPDFGGKKTAFLLLDDVLRDSGGVIVKATFNNLTYNNSFPDSSINKWLNDETDGFIFHAGLNAYQEGILNTTYSPDNDWGYSWQDSPSKASSKVFLLGAGEAVNPKYFKDGNIKFKLDSRGTKGDSHNYGANVDRSADADYWLRSPGPFDISSVVVLADGQVGVYGFTADYSELAMRPALKIDISSAVFKSILISYPK
jgi:hypothetical protein